MIIDTTEIPIIPGNHGNDCPGNGEHFDKNGKLIECRCDECDYALCCFESNQQCSSCHDQNCPNINHN